MSKNHRIDVARDDEAFDVDTSSVYSDTDADMEAAGAAFDYRKKYENTPLVVIAGRPNVGKSTPSRHRQLSTGNRYG